MRTIVFQHGATKGPGRLGATLRDHGFKLDIHRLDLAPSEGGKPVPTDIDNVQAVVILGGDQSANDALPWLEAQREFIRKAHAAELPILGVCLGAQQIARALGGTVERLPTPQVGFHPVSLNHLGQTETVLRGIPWNVHQFCTNSEHVATLPEGAKAFGSSPSCPNSIFHVGLRTFGFQYHFELDRASIDQWRDIYDADFAAAGMDRDAFNAQADTHYEMFARSADRLCVNLATFCVPFDQLTAV